MKHRRLQLLFASYVIPTVGAMLISGAYQLIDGFFIGNFIGAAGLAGANIGWSYITLLLGFGLLVGVGTGSLYSIAKGADEHERALRILGQTLVLIMIPGGLLGFFLYQSAPFLVSILGDPSHAASAEFLEASRLAIDFVRVFAVSAPFVIGSLALPFLVRNVGSPYRATLYMAIGVSLNIISSYLLIVVLEWSVFGAALASVIGETCAMLLGFRFVFFKSGEPIQWRHVKPDLKLIGEILLNGGSAFFMYIYVGFIMALHHKMLVKYGGTLAVSAYTITGYIITVYYFGIEGVANGIQPVISKLYGGEKHRSARAIIRMMVFVGMLYGITLTLVLQLFPGFFTLWFTSDPALTEVAVHAIRFNLFVLFLEGVFVLVTVFFQAIGEGAKALVISIGNLFIQVPFLFILPRFLDLDGVWLTMPIASIVLAIPVTYWAWKRYQRIG